MTRRAKIVCTLGPASSDVATISELIEAGMDVARLNLSHGTHDEHARRIENVRKAANDLGRDIPITKVRGTWHEYQGIPLMPTFHPAFVLRQYTRQNRRLVWDDLKAALARARAGGS